MPFMVNGNMSSVKFSALSSKIRKHGVEVAGVGLVMSAGLKVVTQKLKLDGIVQILEYVLFSS